MTIKLLNLNQKNKLEKRKLDEVVREDTKLTEREVCRGSKHQTNKTFLPQRCLLVALCLRNYTNSQSEVVRHTPFADSTNKFRSICEKTRSVHRAAPALRGP